MKFVVFGLSMSSSWGNGHATLWRGLCRALGKRGHQVVFFERDVPYYSAHRDSFEIEGLNLQIYPDWNSIHNIAQDHLSLADVAVVTSYCPDGIAAADLCLSSTARLKVFYDLDTPITLAQLSSGNTVSYLPPAGLKDFDLVLSFTGGSALTELKSRLGARRVAPLYGSVDQTTHYPVSPHPKYVSDFSYLGTYSEDRQEKVNSFFVASARHFPERRFVMAGSLYPENFPWTPNIFYVRHLPPKEHSLFYCSSRLTLNVTREPMAKMGYCPSGRLFEAAACGVPIVSDAWEGLDQFFQKDSEILVATETSEAIEALQTSDGELLSISRNARERTLSQHTSERRAQELENILEAAVRPLSVTYSNSASSSSTVSLKNFNSSSGPTIWGIVPAAGAGTRIQPLAFSKELLPVGRQWDEKVERPRAISEFLLERMVLGGATRICFVVSPGKTDIMTYFGGNFGSAHLCYMVQPQPAGLCDALFRVIPLIRNEDVVTVGLPDTVWFPEEGFHFLHSHVLSFLLFPVQHPEFFDAVETDQNGNVLEIRVKQPLKNGSQKTGQKKSWIWGAFKMPGKVFHELFRLWCSRDQKDEYFGTLVNAYLAQGGEARAVPAGTAYVDVGTLNGYREAIQTLSERPLRGKSYAA